MPIQEVSGGWRSVLPANRSLVARIQNRVSEEQDLGTELCIDKSRRLHEPLSTVAESTASSQKLSGKRTQFVPPSHIVFPRQPWSWSHPVTSTVQPRSHAFSPRRNTWLLGSVEVEDRQGKIQALK